MNLLSTLGAQEEEPSGPKHKKNKRPEFSRPHYTEVDLNHAIETLAFDPHLSISKVANAYGIPKSTLRDKIHGRSSVNCRKGPRPVLQQMCKDAGINVDFEAKIYNYLKDQARRGFALSLDNLKQKVKKLIEAEQSRNSSVKNPFPSGLPGRKWCDGFLARHPDLSMKSSEHHSLAKAALSEEKIRKWFHVVSGYLQENELSHLLDCPERVYNCDETSFNFCEKSGRFIGIKGEGLQHVDTGGNEKENLTVMITASAEGQLLPPSLVFQYVRMPPAVKESCPPGWQFLKSKRGWMDGPTMLEYLKHFHRYLVNKDLLDEEGDRQKVILFLDGHVSHRDIEVSSFCEEHGIILICLVANATHILQPLDVGVNGPLKKKWARELQNHKQNFGTKINKLNFASHLKIVLDSIFTDTIVNSFRKCGLFPFTPDAIDYSFLLSHYVRLQNECAARVEQAGSYEGFLSTCGIFLPPGICNQMDEAVKAGVSTWDGDDTYTAIFNIWCKVKGVNTVNPSAKGTADDVDSTNGIIDNVPAIHDASESLAPDEAYNASEEGHFLCDVVFTDWDPDSEHEDHSNLHVDQTDSLQSNELSSNEKEESDCLPETEPVSLPADVSSNILRQDPYDNLDHCLTDKRTSDFCNEQQNIPGDPLSQEQIFSPSTQGSETWSFSVNNNDAEEEKENQSFGQIDISQVNEFGDDSRDATECHERQALQDVSNSQSYNDLSPDSLKLLQRSELPETKKRKRRFYSYILSSEEHRSSKKPRESLDENCNPCDAQKKILTNLHDKTLPSKKCGVCNVSFLDDLNNKRKKLDVVWLFCNTCLSWNHYKCIPKEMKTLNAKLSAKVKSGSDFNFTCCC